MNVRQSRRRLVARFKPSMLDNEEMHARVTYCPQVSPHAALHPDAELFMAPGPVRIVAEDGCWKVPPDQRPQEWPTMGLREQ